MRVIGRSLALAVALSAGCAREIPRIAEGTRVGTDLSTELWASPTGTHVATLAEAAPSKEVGAPQDVLIGALALAKIPGGPSRRLAGGVSNLPGSLLFSTDGAWLAFLGGYSIGRANGELRLAKTAGGEAESVAGGATFFSFSPGSDWLAYVAQGDLFLKPLAGGETLTVATGVSMAEFAPGGGAYAGRLLVKRSVRGGGALLSYDLATRRLSAVAHQAGSFRFSPNGEAFAFRAEGLLPAEAVASDSKLGGTKAPVKQAPGLYLVRPGAQPRRVSEARTTEFHFSPDSKRLAFLTPAAEGGAGNDLHVVDGDGEARRISSRTNSYVVGPDGSVALLGAFDERSSAGTLGLLPPEGGLVEVARNVKSFQFSSTGRYLFATQIITRNGLYLSALLALRVAEPTRPAQLVDTGVTGFLLDAAEQRIAYKTRCTDGARACTLLVADLDAAPIAPAVDGGESIDPATLPLPSQQLATRVALFDWLPGAEQVVAVTSRRAGKHSGELLFALGIVKVGPQPELRLLDDRVGGEFVLAGPGRSQVAYLVSEAGREGLYSVDPNEATKAIAAPR